MGIDTSKQSEYTLWELPDPLVWCAEYQYSLLIVDARGTWWSEGEAAYYFSPEEGRDGYDIVEWVSHQSWNTGKVGWGAVSYFAMSAYQVAVLKPPHLTAIMPWEGMSDIYREVNVVGGIPTVTFQHFWMGLTGNGLGANEDAATMAIEQPLLTPLWASKVVDWSKIDIPAFSITGWSSLALHLRGTIAAWKGFQSKNKYLWVHAGREWAVYYSDLGQKRQKAFWDRFLKGQHTEVDDWKPIELEVRETCEQSVTRYEQSWPPPASKLTAFVLDSESILALASTTRPNEAASVSFYSHLTDSSVHWNHTFASRTEITGDSSVKLFIQAMGYPDVDLYVAVQKLDRDGQHIRFYNQTQVVEASAMHGWLRVSHREKDEAASRPGRPVHLHQRRQWLRPCDVVEVEVELWPSSTVWEEGETLRLVVQGHSFFADTSPVTNRNANSHNYGELGEMVTQVNKPNPFIEIIGLTVFCTLASRIRNSRLALASLANAFAIVGASTLYAFDVHQRWHLMAGFWAMMAFIPCGFLLGMGTISGNIAGHAKKVTAQAIMITCYCCGCIVGPQLYTTPPYKQGLRANIVALAVSLFAGVSNIAYMHYENRKRKAFLEANRHLLNEDHYHFRDLTDKQNPFILNVL
ncbi:family hydrolase [Fusarium phyllophilum]|uniref:Family hydrolase n=1 Tax=Fusarium phyllophilum TaxID=47803 RepID=A0A8H5K6S0_9HYPO|nr:family hydrolase [Fusarium phyllophilum]